MDTDTAHRELENVVEILNELHVIEKIYKAKKIKEVVSAESTKRNLQKGYEAEI